MKLTIPLHALKTQTMNTFQAINNALDIALAKTPRSILMGQDVAFGGVFRCTMDLQDKYGCHRVFNTPLNEQGIVGFGIGAASLGYTVIAEIQFADYAYTAFDQMFSEAAKYRYRSGGVFQAGGLTVRMPYGAVGHGGVYHSQSPEAYFVHTAGLKVVVPRGPYAAKGLLLASVRDKNPVVFMEPKICYRLKSEQVPLNDYEISLGRACVMKQGCDVTVVGYGAQMDTLEKAVQRIEDEMHASCELIDLQTLLPWDADTVEKSVNKTGRMVIAHEAPRTLGFASEVCSEIAERCFLKLVSPVMRVCGFDTPFPCSLESLYLPGVERCCRAIRDCLEF